MSWFETTQFAKTYKILRRSFVNLAGGEEDEEDEEAKGDEEEKEKVKSS